MSPTEIELFRAGDALFMQTLYTRQRAKLLAYARHYLHDRDEAEDAVAETWEVAWEERDRYEGSGVMDPWLLKICVSICMGRLHNRKREAELKRWSADLDYVDVSERVAEAAAMMAERATKTVSAVVHGDSAKQRRAVDLGMLPDIRGSESQDNRV